MKTSDSARGRGFESHPLRHNLESPLGYDMYPLYWITSKGGIFMRYSYEFKRKYELVCQVLAGQGLRAVAIVAGINSDNCINGFINTKLWDTMVLLINLKDDLY